MEETISLKEIVQTIKKRLIMILIITIAAVLISGIVTKVFMTPQYDASTQVLVNQKNDQTNQIDATAIQTTIQLINTYSVVIKSPTILSEVIKNLNLEMTPDQLAKAITVNSAQNSQVFTVTVETASSTRSVKIANEVARVFKDKIQSIMKVDNVSVLSKAELAASLSPVKPSLKMNVAIAFVVGLMVSIGIAFLLDYLDNTVKTEEDIEKQLGLPVLGAIVDMAPERNKRHHKKPVKKTVRGGQFEA
jgi:capsular polysaccharide biosynthesis protein